MWFSIAVLNFFLGAYFSGILYIGCCILLSINFFLIKTGDVLYAKFIMVYPILFIPILHFLVYGKIPDHQYISIIPLTATSIFFARILYMNSSIFWVTFSLIVLYNHLILTSGIKVGSL
jgi:hypothetical protein